ncbi:MAG: hypothetical protein ACI9YB_000937 [Halioglobus sp.]|jgi:hypothetical protein
MAWELFTSGLLLSLVGCTFLFYIAGRWEEAMKQKVSILVETKLKKLLAEELPSKEYASSDAIHTDEPTPQNSAAAPLEALISEHKSAQETIHSLNLLLLNKDQTITEIEKEIEQKNQDIFHKTQEIQETHQEIENLRAGIEKREEEFHNYQLSMQDQLSQKDKLLSEYQETISEQSALLEKRHKTIHKLENKVRDLNYEVKTLLQLGSVPTPQEHVEETEESSNHPLMEVFDSNEFKSSNIDHLYQPMSVSSNKEIHTPYDAAVRLQRCLETAQRLRGINNLGGSSPRFSNVSLDHYAIDLRRLFDSFRNENSCTILIYSQSKDKLLFVNNHVKSSLGWSPEKFVKDFHNLVHKGAGEWKTSIDKLNHAPESQARLMIQSKNGEDKLIHCHLGIIQSGIFKNHVIGILFPV